MVFYFSGTGNSQLVAVRIAEMTGDKAVSINRYMKKGEKRCSVRNARWYLLLLYIPGVCQGWWSNGLWRMILKAAAMLILY